MFDFAKESRIPTVGYVKDTVRALLLLRHAEGTRLSRRVHNVDGLSRTVGEIAIAVRCRMPWAGLEYRPVESLIVNMKAWPQRDDSRARAGWGWAPQFELEDCFDDLSREVRANPTLCD